MDEVKTAADAAVDSVADAGQAVIDAVMDAVGTVADKTRVGVTPPLPETRAELLARHRELRHRRDAAPLHSRERAEAMEEIGRVEVEIARIERAMDPPRV